MWWAPHGSRERKGCRSRFIPAKSYSSTLLSCPPVTSRVPLCSTSTHDVSRVWPVSSASWVTGKCHGSSSAAVVRWPPSSSSPCSSASPAAALPSGASRRTRSACARVTSAAAATPDLGFWPKDRGKCRRSSWSSPSSSGGNTTLGTCSRRGRGSAHARVNKQPSAHARCLRRRRHPLRRRTSLAGGAGQQRLAHHGRRLDPHPQRRRLRRRPGPKPLLAGAKPLASLRPRCPVPRDELPAVPAARHRRRRSWFWRQQRSVARP